MFKWLFSLLWVRPPKLQLNGTPVDADDTNVIRPRRHLIDFGAKVQIPADPAQRKAFEELLMEKLSAGFDVFEQAYHWNAKIAARTWNLVLVVSIVFLLTFRTQIVDALRGKFDAISTAGAAPLPALIVDDQPGPAQPNDTP